MIGHGPIKPVTVYFFVVLRFRFDFDLPIFISSCGLGFIRTSAPMRRLVPSIVFEALGMDKSHRSKQPLDSEALEAIGALVTHYSALEYMVGMAIWSLSGLGPHKGALITSKLSLKQTFELLLDLARFNEIPETELALISQVDVEFSKTNGISARRNKIVHSTWALDPTTKRAIAIGQTRSGRHKLAYATAASIEGVTRDLCAQGRILSAIFERLGLFPDSLDLVSPLKTSRGKR